MKKCGNPDECFALLIQMPINLKNEIKMWETILKATERPYKTTYEEDLEILKKQDLTNNQRNSVTIRSDEKRILTAYKNMAEKVIEMANMTREEAEENLDENQCFYRYF